MRAELRGLRRRIAADIGAVADKAVEDRPIRKRLVVAPILAAILAAGSASQPAGAQPSRLPKVSLTSLIAQGFEIKAATGNQVGVVGTLILQKDNEVFMCVSKDLSIEPTAFECWAVK